MAASKYSETVQTYSDQTKTMPALIAEASADPDLGSTEDTSQRNEEVLRTDSTHPVGTACL